MPAWRAQVSEEAPAAAENRPSAGDWSTYRRLLGYVRPYWFVFLLAIIGFLVGSAAEAYFVKLFGDLIDNWDDIVVHASWAIPATMCLVALVRGSGEVIGEMSLLLDLPRTATVRACDDIRVFAMDRAAFEQLVEDGDVAALKFGMALSRVLASRVVDLNSKLVALARERGESVPESREPVGLSEDFMGWWDTYS